MSPPWRWYGESPPSPVLCMHPASAAPRLSAVIAVPDIEPKLIAEMFTTEAGRNALARPRGPPSTLALGRPVVGRVVVRQRLGEGAVLDDRVAGSVLDVVVGAEPGVVVLLLRRGVDPGALVAAERPLLVVAGDDVLPQLGADRLQPVAGVRDHRVVAQQRVLLLGQVADRDGPTARPPLRRAPG